MNLRQRKALVSAFLERCNRYADEKLRDYENRLATGAGDEDPGLREKIGRWTVYREFNQHAIGELASDRLDDWFSDLEAD